jgi:hypothetical protein
MSEQYPGVPDGVLRPMRELGESPAAEADEANQSDQEDDFEAAGGDEQEPYDTYPPLAIDWSSSSPAGKTPVQEDPPWLQERELPVGPEPAEVRPDEDAVSPAPPLRTGASSRSAASWSAVTSRARGEDLSLGQTGTEARPAEALGDQAKIGLWGSTGSGKTTYLAALRHAVSHPDPSSGKWVIYPLDSRSERMMTDFSHRLVQTRQFPEPTELGAISSLRWEFLGDLTGSRFVPRRRLGRRVPTEARFVLDLIDVSGEAFGHAPADRNVPPHVVDGALDHLAQSQGLIYLFDPIAERHERTATDYLDRTLTQLAGKIRREEAHRMVGPHLPHYISVCVTKFDHPRLFQQARRAGLVNYGLDGMPRVLNEHAEAFFNALCNGDFWDERDEQSYASAAWVRRQLQTYFRPDRIRYYVSSSIGFRTPPGWDPAASKRPGWEFNPQDFANVHESNGVVRIRGPIHPINVLEPLVALHQRLTGRR